MSIYSKTEKQLLLQLASDSIAYGLEHQQMMPVDITQYPENLQAYRASFVTLYSGDQELRGCIGSLEAYQSLVQDVVHNAYAAAFSDPRFIPLSQAEFPQIKIHISILSKATPIHFDSEEDLISQLRPNIDGLIMTEKGLRGTFLPVVWESLMTPKAFLNNLKLKTGLPRDYWSETISVERYTVESIQDDTEKTSLTKNQ